MAYVTPTIRSVGDAVTAADYNIMANDVIDHESRLTQLKRLAFQTRTTSFTVDQMAFASAANMFGTSAIWTAAGTTTLNVRVVRSSGANGAVYMGNGGSALLSYLPGFIAVYGPPLT